MTNGNRTILDEEASTFFEFSHTRDGVRLYLIYKNERPYPMNYWFCTGSGLVVEDRKYGDRMEAIREVARNAARANQVSA